MKNFKVHGAEAGSQISKRLDEIVIYASPKTIRELGMFLIHAADEMSSGDIAHIHLQDTIKRFSYRKYVDIIAVRSKP